MQYITDAHSFVSRRKAALFTCNRQFDLYCDGTRFDAAGSFDSLEIKEC